MTSREAAEKAVVAARHLSECDFHPVMSPHMSCPDCARARADIEECLKCLATEESLGL